MTRKEVIEKLLDQATELSDHAVAAQAVADAFRPAFLACWENDVRKGKLIHGKRALELNPFVIDQERNAKNFYEMSDVLRQAALMLQVDEAESKKA